MHRQSKACLLIKQSQCPGYCVLVNELTTTHFQNEALASILAAPPDIAIASQVLEGFSGVELARVLKDIDATRHVRFLLLTSYEEADRHLSGLPAETAVIVKDANFAHRFAEHLLRWGVFGKADGVGDATATKKPAPVN